MTKRKKKYDPITDEQREAMREFKDRWPKGTDWKSKLTVAWMHASEPGLLQQLRNSHGPSWLMDYDPDAPEPKTRRKLPGRKAGDFNLNVHGQKYKIQYRVREQETDNDFSEVWFVDILEPVTLKVEAETRPELRELLQTKLDEALAIEFNSVIRVRTLRASYTEPNNSSHVLPGRILGLSHDFLEVGVRPDGRKVWRYPRSSEVKDGEPFQGDADISYGNYGRAKSERIEAFSIIPDTEENRAKLDEMHAAMTALSERFSEAFSPERIEQTLLQSNPGRLLLGS